MLKCPLHTLHAPGGTSRNTSIHTNVGSSLSSTAQVNFVSLDFTDLRSSSLELATLGLPRINLIPLPNLNHSCIWPFICTLSPRPLQTERLSLTSSEASAYSTSDRSYFPLTPLPSKWHCHLSATHAGNLGTSLTSLSHSHPTGIKRVCKFFLLNSSSFLSQLHLPVPIQKFRLSSQDFWYPSHVPLFLHTRSSFLFTASSLGTFIHNSLDQREKHL